jgi:hypothetical protein
LSAAEGIVFLFFADLYLQISRIFRFRVALRASEWCFILVLVFIVSLDQPDSWIYSLKVIIRSLPINFKRDIQGKFTNGIYSHG